MLYNLLSVNGQIISLNLDEKMLEHNLRILSNTTPRARYIIQASLPITIEACVLRSAQKGEVIEIKSGEVTIEVRRKTSSQDDGDIEASCDPQGERVRVDSLDFRFRPYTDSFTERGVVLVLPGLYTGKWAQLKFVIVAEAAQEPGRVIQIITEATETVEQQLLKRLIPIPMPDAMSV